MVQLNFSPFPDFITERLLLRSLIPEDENEIFVLRSDERILKYLDSPIAKTIDDASKFIRKINSGIDKNEWIYWGISLRGERKLIGTICIWNISKENISADIGFVLHPDYQGKGFIQETLLKIIQYGFETMKLKCINAEVDPNNSKSIKLLEKNNFIIKSKIDNTVFYTLRNQD